MGGTIIGLCETWDVPYHKIMGFIRKDKGRNDLYIQAMNDRADWAVEALLRELRLMAFVDIRKLYAEDGSLLPMNQWPEDVARAVNEITPNEHGKKLKMESKMSAIKMLGDNLALFATKHEVEHIVRLEDLLAGSYKPPQIEGVKDVTPKIAEPVEGTSAPVDHQQQTDGEPAASIGESLPPNLEPEKPPIPELIPDPFA